VLINEMPRYEILDEASMAELDRGWRRIVSELGIDFLHEEALAALAGAGQNVEGELVKFDPDWILEQVAKAPREFDLQARNPERSVHIGGNHMVFGAVYGCPFVREGLERREATYADFENLVRLSQSFPQLDSPGGTICEPNDKPLDSRHLDMVYALLTLSDKPFMGSVTSGPNAEDTIAMAEMVFGRESLERTPAIVSLINVNSPLRYDDRMLSALLAYAKANQALVITPFLLMGAMSPVSVPATLAQQVAEALAGIALVQTVRPGSPVVFGSFLSNTDMQSGSPSFGTPESAVGLLCTGQIARHFGLPFRGGGGMTSSQAVDAQSAYEAAMTLWPTFLAGTNFVMHSAGWLESGLVSCYEKFVVDVELLRMLHEVFKPLRIDEETLAYSAHLEVGQGGHFLGAAHTLERFRECFYRPLLSSTENYERWSRNGGRDAGLRDLTQDARGVREAADRRGARGGAEGLRRPAADGARRLRRAGMATVSDVMATRLLTVEASLPLAEAAQRMHGRSVGAVLVLEGEQVRGILTERDVLRAVAEGRVEGTSVGEWMTRNPETIDPSDTTRLAASMMIHGGYRHLPVVDGTNPVGIVSIRDLMRVVLDDETPRGV
jgi:trimethylamine---corrinoid protein Co-methyltransferase